MEITVAVAVALEWIDGWKERLIEGIKEIQ